MLQMGCLGALPKQTQRAYRANEKANRHLSCRAREATSTKRRVVASICDQRPSNSTRVRTAAGKPSKTCVVAVVRKTRAL